MARNAVAYEQDFYAWTQEQAQLLRGGDLSAIDTENLSEEIEAKGRRERRELRNRLTVLLAHLLKWEHQPDQRSAGFLGTIVEQRRQIGAVLPTRRAWPRCSRQRWRPPSPMHEMMRHAKPAWRPRSLVRTAPIRSSRPWTRPSCRERRQGTDVASYAPATVTFTIFTGVSGRSPASVGVVSIFFTTSMPAVILPNTGCFDGPGVNQSR